MEISGGTKMNTHSKMKCSISNEDITVVSYPPYGSAWTGFTGGRSEIICPWKRSNNFSPVCGKESGRMYTDGTAEGENVCILAKR